VVIDKNINCEVFINVSAKNIPKALSSMSNRFAGLRITLQRDKRFLMPIVSSAIKAQFILVSGGAVGLFGAVEAVGSSET